MAQALTIPPPGFDELQVEEKLDYVQQLWQRITAEPGAVPVPDWHREILAERLADYRRDPSAGEDWELVKERLRNKLEARFPR